MEPVSGQYQEDQLSLYQLPVSTYMLLCVWWNIFLTLWADAKRRVVLVMAKSISGAQGPNAVLVHIGF